MTQHQQMSRAIEGDYVIKKGGIANPMIVKQRKRFYGKSFYWTRAFPAGSHPP